MRQKLTYLFIAFGLSFIILIALSYVFFRQLDDLTGSAESVESTYGNINILSSVDRDLTLAESSQRGFMLTGDSMFLSRLNESAARLRISMLALKLGMDGEHRRNQDIKQLQGFVTMRLAYLHNNMADLSLDRDTLRARLSDGKTAMDSCRKIITRMEQVERQDLASKSRDQENFISATPGRFRLIFTFSSIVFLLSFLFITREFTGRIRYQNELERSVQELSRVNTELQDYSFVASHRMQEPLRKIQTFSNRLRVTHAGSLNEEGRLISARIDQLAGEMQGLMEDFVHFMSLSQNVEKLASVNLNRLIAEVETDIRESYQKPVVVEVGQLSSVTGYPKQLYSLFRALLDNSIKFFKPGETPHIKITNEIIAYNNLPPGKTLIKSDFIKISFLDKGIGFNNEFREKIFGLFQRLDSDNHENQGKGVGLSIVRRVMFNHHGFVVADGTLGEGSVFYLYFPIKKAF
ncbi:MAG: CHASE3 domain-containing protein [Gemmatimonadaceae bacterium]|nr:CHASE3 domain-containing protein [Chitinophagaceae bacterium]